MKIIRKRGDSLIIKTIRILVVNSFYYYKTRQKKRESRLSIYKEISVYVQANRTSMNKKVSDFVQANRASMNKKVSDYVQPIGLLSI